MTPAKPDSKPTSNRQKSSNSRRDRFTVGIDSVLSVWCRFLFGQTNLSGRDLSNMFERSLPEKIVCCLSVICRCGGVGLIGECRSYIHIRPPVVGLDILSVLDQLYVSGICRPTWHQFKTDSRLNQVRHNTELHIFVGFMSVCNEWAITLGCSVLTLTLTMTRFF